MNIEIVRNSHILLEACIPSSSVVRSCVRRRHEVFEGARHGSVLRAHTSKTFDGLRTFLNMWHRYSAAISSSCCAFRSYCTVYIVETKMLCQTWHVAHRHMQHWSYVSRTLCPTSLTSVLLPEDDALPCHTLRRPRRREGGP